MLKNFERFILIILFFTLPSLALATNDDIYGSASNGLYTNKYFGFSMQFPKEWKVASLEQMKQITLAGKKVAFGNDQNAQAIANSDLVEKVYLFTISSKEIGMPENDLIQAKAMKISYAQNVNGEQFLEAAKYGLEHISRLKPSHISQITDFKINGKTFKQMTVEIPVINMTMTETFYVITCKGYNLLFMSAYVNPSESKKLQQIIGTIKFG